MTVVSYNKIQATAENIWDVEGNVLCVEQLYIYSFINMFILFDLKFDAVVLNVYLH